MEIGKTFCGRTDVRTYGRTDGRTHLSSNLLGHRRGDDLKIELFDPHFEEVRDGVEPWLMARWKARVRLPIGHN